MPGTREGWLWAARVTLVGAGVGALALSTLGAPWEQARDTGIGVLGLGIVLGLVSSIQAAFVGDRYDLVRDARSLRALSARTMATVRTAELVGTPRTTWIGGFLHEGVVEEATVEIELASEGRSVRVTDRYHSASSAAMKRRLRGMRPGSSIVAWFAPGKPETARVFVPTALDRLSLALRVGLTALPGVAASMIVYGAVAAAA